jgi:tetratricopeptide (TPR) repeat protein
VTGDLVQRQNHVLAQAYGSLAAGQRQLLSRMACFRSPVAYAVVEKTCGSTEENRQFQSNLRDLISRGLVQHDRTTQRFDLHPIVRRYAYDRMGNSERTSTHEQLRDYFAAVPDLGKVKTVADLAPVIELYHHMVRAGQYDEAMQLFVYRINKPTHYQLGAYQLQIDLLRTLFPQGEDYPPQLQDKGNQSWTMNQLANSYSLNGQPVQAVPLFEQAVSTSEKLGDKQNLAIVLGNMAYMAQHCIGALLAAETHLRRSIVLSQENEDDIPEAAGHLELARLLAYRGKWVEAGAELRASTSYWEKTNNFQGFCTQETYRALSSLLQVRTGDVQAAETALVAAQISLKLADVTARIHYPYVRDYIRSHWLIGAAHRVNGNLDLSDHHLNEALSRCRTIDLVESEANILIDLARLRLDQAQPTEAHRLATEAQAIAQRCGYVLQEADAQLVLAELAQRRGERSAALECAREARRLATCDGGEFVYRVAWEEAGRMLEGF